MPPASHHRSILRSHVMTLHPTAVLDPSLNEICATPVLAPPTVAGGQRIAAAEQAILGWTRTGFPTSAPVDAMKRRRRGRHLTLIRRSPGELKDAASDEAVDTVATRSPSSPAIHVGPLRHTIWSRRGLRRGRRRRPDHARSLDGNVFDTRRSPTNACATATGPMPRSKPGHRPRLRRTGTSRLHRPKSHAFPPIRQDLTEPAPDRGQLP